MKMINRAQIAKIHILLAQNNSMDMKKEIIHAFTDGRTASTKELSYAEGRLLIQRLAEYDPKERLKSLIFSLAYQAGIIYGKTGEDKKINAAKLNLFLKERGTVKKELNKMDVAELHRVHTQFQAIVNATRSSKLNREAAGAVDSLLKELNLTAIGKT